MEIGGGGGGLLCFKISSKKKNVLKARITCRLAKAEGYKKYYYNNNNTNRRAAILLYRKMELPAAGEHVFAVESIEKKRIRKVCLKSTEGHFYAHLKEDHCWSRFPSPGLDCVISLELR